MKKILHTLSLVFIVHIAMAQTGTVGIGTNTPNQQLDVNGWIKLGDQSSPVPPNTHDEGSIRYNSTSKTLQFNTTGISTGWSSLSPFPTGVICMWSGSFATIPIGWALCDGTNGTPDLRDKFILGATVTADVGTSGGANSHTLTTSEIPSHSHTGTSDATAPSLTFTGTAGTTSAPATQTFTGTLGSTNTVTPTFTGTAGTTSAPATQTFTGTANIATSATTPTFTGTAGTTSAPATQTFTGTANITTSSSGAHTHTVENTVTGWRGYWAAYNGSNETTGSAYTTTTSSSSGAHTHTLTPAGTLNVSGSAFTPAGTVSSHTPDFTPAGTISAITHTYTPAGSLTVGGSDFTPAGTVSGSSHTHTFTTGSTGSGASFDIRPSFYKLAYIMKL